MFAQTTNTNHSINPVGEDGIVRCYCEVEAVRYTAGENAKPANRGRDFFVCGKDRACKFYKWEDELRKEMERRRPQQQQVTPNGSVPLADAQSRPSQRARAEASRAASGQPPPPSTRVSASASQLQAPFTPTRTAQPVARTQSSTRLSPEEKQRRLAAIAEGLNESETGHRSKLLPRQAQPQPRRERTVFAAAAPMPSPTTARGTPAPTTYSARSPAYSDGFRSAVAAPMLSPDTWIGSPGSDHDGDRNRVTPDYRRRPRAIQENEENELNPFASGARGGTGSLVYEQSQSVEDARRSQKRPRHSYEHAALAGPQLVTPEYTSHRADKGKGRAASEYEDYDMNEDDGVTDRDRIINCGSGDEMGDGFGAQPRTPSMYLAQQQHWQETRSEGAAQTATPEATPYQEAQVSNRTLSPPFSQIPHSQPSVSAPARGTSTRKANYSLAEFQAAADVFSSVPGYIGKLERLLNASKQSETVKMRRIERLEEIVEGQKAEIEELQKGGGGGGGGDKKKIRVLEAVVAEQRVRISELESGARVHGLEAEVKSLKTLVQQMGGYIKSAGSQTST